ncbi:MAG: hypothetical protein QGG63_00470 [Candidatus Pacebacteria bacterium]|nr:hypothetical protein [Candidatus Paceibacterota bacterium]|tara:strand:+ start:1775 stop:2077 length:303 start_codon:yes stop_codon:yes gene_type:complete
MYVNEAKKKLTGERVSVENEGTKTIVRNTEVMSVSEAIENDPGIKKEMRMGILYIIKGEVESSEIPDAQTFKNITEKPEIQIFVYPETKIEIVDQGCPSF